MVIAAKYIRKIINKQKANIDTLVLLSQIITYIPKFIFQLIVAIFIVYLICRESPFFRAQNKSKN